MPPTTPSRSDPVVLRSHGLVVTLLAGQDDDAPTRAAATALVQQLCRTVLEFLQRRRTRAGLGRSFLPAIGDQLETWRDVRDWTSTTVFSAHGSLVDARVVEGSFTLTVSARRETFACRLEHDGRRWTCVRLAPIGRSLPPTHRRTAS